MKVVAFVKLIYLKIIEVMSYHHLFNAQPMYKNATIIEEKKIGLATKRFNKPINILNHVRSTCYF